MRFDIVYRYGFFEIRLFGVFDASRFSDVFKTLFSHEKWECNGMILYDATDLAVNHLPVDEVTGFIQECERWREVVGRGKCAFVTPKNDQFTFACMFKRRALFKWDVEMDVFRERGKAVRWLLDDPSTRQMYRVACTAHKWVDESDASNSPSRTDAGAD